jgi:ATP-binding cassette subfamily F protein 3
MLNFTGVTLRRGPRKLLEGATLAIFPGQKVGVVGRNGTGKSSLFAMILGELAADAGEVSVPKSLTIASVAQETPSGANSAIDFVLDGDVELRRLERALTAAEGTADAGKLAAIHERLSQIDGYAAHARAARLLHGLGFAPATHGNAVDSFSGGWRMRLNLGRALMSRCDLLLLDEPTNHLDLDAVFWLQDWLTSFPGTLLLISHDREFLDAVTTHTLHLHDGAATLYNGNYSQFERLRAERLAQTAATREQQQRQIAHLQGFVDRFRAQATKARAAQSRLKMIERIQLVAPAHADSEFDFAFRAPAKLPTPMIRLDRASVGYAGRPQLAQLKLSIEPGDRIGLLGPNGAGKTTLVRLLAGELAPLAGELLRAPELKLGYFAQHQLEQLDVKASAIMHLRRLDSEVPEQALRDFLGGFNFRGERATEAIGPFSGGEKARLALALVVYQRPNLLLLDEPTNHLDLDMRHALELALQDFAGAVVLVSHDRHLMATCCDEFWRVADGCVAPFDGDLDDYGRWLAERGRRSDAGGVVGGASAPVQARRASAEARARTRPLRDELRRLETQMQRLQTRLSEFEGRLADAALYEAANKEELARCLAEQARLRRELQPVEEAWLATMEALESAAG